MQISQSSSLGPQSLDCWSFAMHVPLPCTQTGAEVLPGKRCCNSTELLAVLTITYRCRSLMQSRRMHSMICAPASHDRQQSLAHSCLRLSQGYTVQNDNDSACHLWSDPGKNAACRNNISRLAFMTLSKTQVWQICTYLCR